METTALCSANSFDYVRELGVEDAIDYHQKDWFTQLNKKAK
jgi:NADPH-dependent curcumin reductase CurA